MSQGHPRPAGRHPSFSHTRESRAPQPGQKMFSSVNSIQEDRAATVYSRLWFRRNESKDRLLGLLTAVTRYSEYLKSDSEHTYLFKNKEEEVTQARARTWSVQLPRAGARSCRHPPGQRQAHTHRRPFLPSPAAQVRSRGAVMFLNVTDKTSKISIGEGETMVPFLL